MPADVSSTCRIDDVEDDGEAKSADPPSFATRTFQTSFKSKVPLRPGEHRVIVANCEKGAVEDLETMRGIKANLDATKAANPNLVEISAREVWRSRHPENVADANSRPAPGPPPPAAASRS